MVFSHKDKKRAYNFITNKFFAKFGTLKANTLNHAGRLQYIKSVLSSIPIYYMSTVLFSKTFIEKLNAIMRKFWWAGVEEENQTTPIPFRSWNDICKPTQQGGLGLGIWNWLIRVFSLTLLGTLLLIKTLCFLIFLRPNTTLQPPSGKPVPMSPNPYIGLPFSKLDTT
jgi:hypothetical protein